MTVTRRLAAILAADVVGFSKLIGEDEEGEGAGSIRPEATSQIFSRASMLKTPKSRRKHMHAPGRYSVR
jgi:hypothetical protein